MDVSYIIENKAFVGLLMRTLNHVDTRLVNHGIRVSYIVYHMLKASCYEQQDSLKIALTALLHDIGAYKTEEINEMLSFESTHIWDHSIYGYLFLDHFSPFKAYADIVLLHHVNSNEMYLHTSRYKDEALYVHMADKIDLFLQSNTNIDALTDFLENQADGIFSQKSMQVFHKINMRSILLDLQNIDKMVSIFEGMELTNIQMDALLKLMVYAIDFRSVHTVTHTITTTRISYVTAQLLGLSKTDLTRVYYGAMLHDLGKIGIPVEILEFPGKLSDEEMIIMRNHVLITKDILQDAVEIQTREIALRHHEKLDGSGYPYGLCDHDLNISQRIIAIADILSALIGKRSYKGEYAKEKALSILKEMVSEGKIDSTIVELIEVYYDQILCEVNKSCKPIIHDYMKIHQEYEVLQKEYSKEYTIKK